MKTFKVIVFLLMFVISFPITSCDSLDKINEDPNSPEQVASNYILTWTLVNMAKDYDAKGGIGSPIASLLQYYQRGISGGDRLNSYKWEAEDFKDYYAMLRNVKLIHESAVADGNKIFEGISLTLRASLYGTMTDLWGDCPYSESLRANEEIFFPKYDAQIDIYKGILADLKSADQVFSDPGIGNYNVGASDVMYKGDAAKWKKLANSLRLRYCMRLIEKRSEMTAAGVDIVAEFNDAVSKAFTSNSDDAFVTWLGTTKDNSYTYGPMNRINLSLDYKPCHTIIDYMRDIKDPRFYRWFRPVVTKWDYNISQETVKTHTTMFGDSYSITWKPTTDASLDTSLYVGLSVGLLGQQAVQFNSAGTYVGKEDENPYVANAHNRYLMNMESYVRMDIMGYAEVEFLLAEAAERGGFSISGSAENHFKNAIVASFARWGIQNNANGFVFDTYYANPEVDYTAANNKIERIIQQKWMALYLQMEPWFDWRRTGYPDLKTGAYAYYGPALPLRYQYPTPSQDPKYLVNYNVAVGNLEKTTYVPAGQSADHPYSKMWLIKGTGKPY